MRSFQKVIGNESKSPRKALKTGAAREIGAAEDPTLLLPTGELLGSVRASGKECDTIELPPESAGAHRFSINFPSMFH